ncbi:stage II sporulation protein P [Lutispora thermophila]|nr:stage II sporulation protein P [Lutispora thermophila]
MNIQRRYKNKRFCFIILALMVTLLFFFSFNGDVKETYEVFSNTKIYEGIDEENTNNIFLFFLNNSIPTLKAAYEEYKGITITGIDDFFSDRLVSLPSKFLEDPLNFFKVTYSGFMDINQGGLYTSGTINDNLPDIKSFSDVPQEEIYFSEEDEYTAEEMKEHESLAETDSENDIKKEDFDVNLPLPDKVNLPKKEPQILIYHSHATESYMPNTASNYHTMTEKYNVVSVGAIMAQVLQDKYGYKVIHDKTYHDKDSYAYSYSNSLVTIKKHVAKYPSIKVILDIHRDAFTAKDDKVKTAKKNDYTITINGKKAAKVMLVIGKKNPNYEELEKFAAYIKKKMDKLYPGLYMRTDRHNTKYNQYFSNYSMLIEVGCMLNTYEEVHYSAELMGNVIGEVLKDLQE